MLVLWCAVVAVLLLVALCGYLPKHSSSWALHPDPRVYSKFKLVKRTQVSHNTLRLEFALPSPSHRLGLPLGRHVSIRPVGQPDLARSYTPISSDDRLGSFELLIKVYPSGKLTPILEKLALGDFVEVAGPRGLLTYRGNGAVVIKGRTETRTTVKELAMVAGGSGITPMFQVAQAVLSNPNDSTRVSLIFANVTEQDILLRQELETLQEQHGRLRIFFTLDKPPQDWRFGSGFVSAEMMQQHLPAADQDVMLLVCGPPPMVDSVKRLASSLGFASDRVYAF